jgi:hypothetical protein
VPWPIPGLSPRTPGSMNTSQSISSGAIVRLAVSVSPTSGSRQAKLFCRLRKEGSAVCGLDFNLVGRRMLHSRPDIIPLTAARGSVGCAILIIKSPMPLT